MFTRSSSRKKAKDASGPACFPAVREVRVGHGLVMVFAVTRRRLVLRAPRIIEQGVRHVLFFVN